MPAGWVGCSPPAPRWAQPSHPTPQRFRVQKQLMVVGMDVSHGKGMRSVIGFVASTNQCVLPGCAGRPGSMLPLCYEGHGSASAS